MKPNPNNFYVKYFMGSFSVFYLRYFMFDLTINQDGYTEESKKMAVKEAAILIDQIVEDWPGSRFYCKICEIHEDIICSHKHKPKPDGKPCGHNLAYCLSDSL